MHICKVLGKQSYNEYKLPCVSTSSIFWFAAFSTNHFSIRKYLLVILLVIFLIDFSLILKKNHLFRLLLCLEAFSSNSIKYAVVVERITLLFTKLVFDFCLETNPHLWKNVFWQMGLLCSQLYGVAGCHTSK